MKTSNKIKRWESEELKKKVSKELYEMIVECNTAFLNKPDPSLPRIEKKIVNGEEVEIISVIYNF